MRVSAMSGLSGNVCPSTGVAVGRSQAEQCMEGQQQGALLAGPVSRIQNPLAPPQVAPPQRAARRATLPPQHHPRAGHDHYRRRHPHLTYTHDLSAASQPA